jgi:hypothetical protein
VLAIHQTIHDGAPSTQRSLAGTGPSRAFSWITCGDQRRY